MKPSESVDLLVVGAGPVGLFAALCAARHGLKVQVVDQVWRGYAPGHAALLHARSLELLEEAGIASGIRAAGREIRKVSLHVGKAPVLDLDLPSPALAVPQRIVEEALATALQRERVELLTPHQAVTIAQDGAHVDVRVLRRELVTLGSPAHYSEWEPLDSSAVCSKFVIGADGYESRVRAGLGIESVNMGGTETFAMFEVENAEDGGHTMHLCFDDDWSGVMLPLPGRRARWGFQIRDGLDAESDLARLRDLRLQRTPWYSGTTTEEVVWGTVVHFERRLARRLGKQRVWLAGDAAHVTSPLGGQSMNAGLVEANRLARCMANAIQSPGGFVELEDYETEHAREWHKLLGVNVSFEILPGAPEWLAKYARRLVPALPASGVDTTTVLERIGLRLS